MEAARERRLELLATAASRLAAPGQTIATEAIEGRTSSSIVEAARAAQADLIVLGSHGRGALGSAVMGSVAAEVVEYAATPVLVVRVGAVSRLVLADDGSPNAASAHGLLARMPGFRGLPVRVSASERQSGSFWWLQPDAPAEIQAFEESIQADLKEHESLAATPAGELSAAGLVAEGVAPIGDPGPEIVRSAEDFHADLIVMGTRGTTGFERLLLGSVARKVLQHAHCSVLVIRARPS